MLGDIKMSTFPFSTPDLGIAFNVEGMQSDFLIPFEPPEMNTAAKVSTAIDEKDQSDKEDSVTVYDKEMTLLITTVKDIRGAGRSAFGRCSTPFLPF